MSYFVDNSSLPIFEIYCGKDQPGQDGESMLEEQGGGVDTRSLEDRFEDPLCIVASTPYPPRTSS